MTREEIDAMCIEAVRDADRDGVPHIRYHFAARVAAAEREACARLCDSVKEPEADWLAERIRARGKPCF